MSDGFAESDDRTKKLTRMQTVITEFTERLFRSKERAPQHILQDVSGIWSALRAITGGKLLGRVQLNTILLTEIDITMNVGRSIFGRHFGLGESVHGPVCQELQDRVLIVLEYFLAPMQSTLSDDIHYVL